GSAGVGGGANQARPGGGDGGAPRHGRSPRRPPPHRGSQPPDGWPYSRARWPPPRLPDAARAPNRKKPKIPPEPVSRTGASYKYGGTDSENERQRNDLRQLLACRGAEAFGNPRRYQGHRGTGQCQRRRGGRRKCGEAGGIGQCSPAARLRSSRMKTTAPERVDLPVSGMTCAACARSIERTLAQTPGVERANVNLATNTATVEFDP